MADLKSKQIKFPLTGTSVVSSSAQIATDISGSFVADSGSFSTRVTTAETELTNTLVSSSAQIATDISGSFVAPSASFSTRVTTAETELENTLISGSAQIATDISGSFVAPSASFSTRVTTTETELGNTLVSSSAQIADDISGSLSTAAVVGLGAGIISGSSSNSSLTTAIVGEGAGILSGSAQISADISGSLSTAAIVGLGANLVSASAQVDHDSTTNFVANEHIDHTSVSVIAGTGLTGGGTIAANRTLNVIGGTGVTANANDMAIGQDVATTANVLFNHISASGNVSSSGTGSFLNVEVINNLSGVDYTGTGTGSFASIKLQHEGHLSGSLGTITGVLQANITSGSLGQINTTGNIQVGEDISGSSGDVIGFKSGSFQALDALALSGSVQQATQALIDHDSLANFVSDEHIAHGDVSVIAGTGLTGGGTIAANRTLNVIGGTGVTANANDIAIGQDVATTANVTFNHISASGNISGSKNSLLGFDSGSFNINLGVGTTTPAESLEVIGAISASTSGSFLNIDAPDIKATRVHGTILTATQATIDHDSLANFVANEHIDHSSVSVVAGAGLTGGGTIASNRTINVVGGTGVTANANDVAIGQDVADDADVTFASVTTTGNIVAQGDITAQNYIVSSSVTHMTSSIRSGSTVSGDTPADDTHQFTGSLSISGSATDITNTMTASLASIFLQNNGHISSSLGTIKGFSAIDGTTITGTTFTGTSGSFSENLGVNTTTPAEALEVVGSVSASASGSFLNVDVTDNLGVTGIFTLPNIANVSASIAGAVAGGDNLGNHTAEEDLDMDGNSISNVQHISSSGNISGSLGNILGYKSGSFQQLDAIVVSASSVQATSLTGLVGTATQGTIDHDSLANFVANEHVDHSGVTITAGAGLTGGGTIAATRTLAVGAGTGVTVNANDVAIGQAVATTSNVKFNHISGSGNLSGSAGDILGYDSLSILSSGSFGTNLGVGTTTPAESLEVIGAVSASTSGSFLNVNAPHITATNVHGTIKTATQATIDHDSLANFVADEHIAHGDVSVIAGTGLTGGGTIAANRTLNVIGGTGVTANANDVAIGQDVATTANVTFNHISASGNISGSLGNVLGFKSGSFQALDALAFSGSVQQATQAIINHDSLAGFVANEHIDHSSVSVVAGAGLTGGGTIAANRTINVVGGDGITANANDIAITAAQTTITSVLAEDLIIGEDAQTKIDFETANEIHFYADNTEQVYLGDNIFGPESDSDVDLGSNSVRWKDAYVDSVVSTGSGSFAHVAVTGEGGQISGSQSTLIGFKNSTITSGSFDYINATGLMTASGLETSGDVIAFGSSDRELKDDIKPIENPLEKMEKIGGYTFTWNDKQSTYKGKDVGVVAQEIQSVLPEIVAGRANGYLGVKYEKIVPLLIESIKELKQEIDEIKEKCDCLNK